MLGRSEEANQVDRVHAPHSLQQRPNNLMAEIADCPNLAQECWTALEGNVRRNLGIRQSLHE